MEQASAMLQHQEVFRSRVSEPRGATIGRSVLAFLLLSVSTAMGADDGLKPWSANLQPSDVQKSHVEEISAGKQAYKVAQGGTMDGRNCRSPMGCGMSREGALLQKWESNRSVRMENVGDSDVINPWLSNGRNNFRSATEIVASAITPGMTDAEKAKALWFQEIQHRFHDGGDNEQLDPVKLFNTYGFNVCGSDSISLATLWVASGMKAAPVRALGHCISQVFYDNRWHFYDGDLHTIFLLRDNETVAGEEDIARDHDLIRRTHCQGILQPDNSWDGPVMSSWYFDKAPIWGQRGHDGGTTMNMLLRPSEAIVWRWGQLNPPKFHGGMGPPVYPSLICNGLWEYAPDFSKETWRKGAASVENITAAADGLAAAQGTKGTVVWTMRSPYAMVGGRIEADATDAQFSISTDGKTWQTVKDNFDQSFPVHGPAIGEYRLRCQLQGPARLRKLAIVNDLQMAPMALPEMAVGENSFTYSDQSTGERHVRITHNWVERSASKPPSAPEAAICPPDGGEASGTDISFQWKPGDEPAGDYQFVLSERPDMRWPLSMDFYKLISRTADKNKARYTLAEPGLLTPDRKYYWHVRAMNAQGVWGDWSKTWSFIPRGAAYPLNVTVAYDADKDMGTLRWQANSVGRQPVKYRVYGSDEKGFTIADKNFKSTVGVTKEEMAAWDPWFPANFIGETAATEMPVLGCNITSPSANKTYYRVVAVDDQGQRSGPSDYATSPRPVIYSKPVATTKVGATYRYQASVTRSLGDLSSRMNGDKQVNGYFDIEKPAFTLDQGPAWLKIDGATGMLSGTPDAAGKVEVAVSATINREVRRLNEQDLIWGIEKVLSTANERVGAATQKFVIAVE